MAELPGKPEGLRFTPGADPVDMDFPAEVLEEVFSSGGPLLPEEDQPPETQIIHFPHQPVSEEEGKPAAETTATEEMCIRDRSMPMSATTTSLPK